MRPPNLPLVNPTRLALLAALFALLVPLTAEAAPPAESEVGKGPVTKLPLPRYASLKSNRVNLREGPSKDHRTLWVFQRAGLPVEIVAEFETWRRIRDSEGTEGWVLHNLLSGRRTAVVIPPSGERADSAKSTVPLTAAADEQSAEEARLQPGVIGSVKSCGGTWCRLIVPLPDKRGDVDGYIRQSRLWGVYPNERVE